MSDGENAGNRTELLPGYAFPAFDHLGEIAHQAKTAAACGATILDATGLGGEGYSGLPEAAQWAKSRESAAAYVREAKSRGIRLMIGYLCATSIVDLPKFDAHWDASFRPAFTRRHRSGGSRTATAARCLHGTEVLTSRPA